MEVKWTVKSSALLVGYSSMLALPTALLRLIVYVGYVGTWATKCGSFLSILPASSTISYALLHAVNSYHHDSFHGIVSPNVSAMVCCFKAGTVWGRDYFPTPHSVCAYVWHSWPGPGAVMNPLVGAGIGFSSAVTIPPRRGEREREREREECTLSFLWKLRQPEGAPLL